MKRRDFFQNSALLSVGASFLLPTQGTNISNVFSKGGGLGKKAKNIIFLVSDGMSSGTLNMGELFIQRKYGRGSNWINLYRENKVTRALMDMASANSMITDSAAASSSWGGGVRVKNGRLNMSENGEEFLPIWQKFQKAGKKVGCVTTVPITHATPAGFCVNTKSRSMQPEIAEKYLSLKFDVMMGGGSKYFNERKDNKNLYEDFRQSGFTVVNNKKEMTSSKVGKPVLGVFSTDGLPYELDRLNDPALFDSIPSLAEMTSKAIDLMKEHEDGFCLQVEGGKVDWAAHANDAAGLIYDQVAFDDAIKVAMDFAEKDGNTLVVITSDHGNANPGLYYGDKSDMNFEKLFSFKVTNEWILMNTKRDETTNQLIEKVQSYQNYTMNQEEAKFILEKYADQKDTGVYNAYKLPFEKYAEFQSEHTSIAFGGNEHSADFTELAMYGPGSEKLTPFIKNTDLHYFMLQVAEVENKF